MNNIVKIKNFDPVIEKYIASHDKKSIKKTLAFEYFNNDLEALTRYIDIHVNNKTFCLDFSEPKAKWNLVFRTEAI